MTKTIPLTRGKMALVDDDDFEWLSRFKWHYQASYTGYAARTVKNGLRTSVVYMHRAILLPRKGMDIDHINHDTLDNRKENLRECTRRENAKNSKNRGKWRY